MVISSLALSLLLALVGVFVLTDAGQLLRISKRAVVVYFRNHMWIMALSVALFTVALLVNVRQGQLPAWVMAVSGFVLLGCFLATKYLVPYVMFPAKQRKAVYRSIRDVEAESDLRPEDTVYVIDHNGVTRAFPQKHLWVSHIFGGDYGGDEVVLTYCVLTNLPVPYVNDLDGEAMDLKVLAQTNNNLLLWDRRSGEIIQQMTNVCEISRRKLEPLPLVEMSWKAYRELFPEGEVLHNPLTSPMERLLSALMPIETAHSGDSWLFKTVALDDDRLSSKEKVIAIEDGGDAIAYTRDYIRKRGVVNERVGGKSIAIAHIPEYDVFVAFDRRRGSEEIDVTGVDVFGNTPDHGRLERAFVHNGPMWAVWLHYHPQTKLFK